MMRVTKRRAKRRAKIVTERNSGCQLIWWLWAVT